MSLALLESNGSQYTLMPFGSTLTGIDVAGSDLDLCIVDHDREAGWQRPPGRNVLPTLYYMGKLASVLRKRGFQDVEPISGANVPICKFTGMSDGFRIKADVNCECCDKVSLVGSSLTHSQAMSNLASFSQSC